MDVQYIDQVRGVDPGYLDPQVSERVSQAITDVVLDDALERLFGFEPGNHRPLLFRRNPLPCLPFSKEGVAR